ncbi:hypothetical protein BAC2_00528 [uncultured bacterium]|nr:hypothetical protein BAC2_00528 [uncultured bacterium]
MNRNMTPIKKTLLTNWVIRRLSHSLNHCKMLTPVCVYWR